MKIKDKKEKLILGLGVFAHDTSAAFMRNGKVLFAGEQERFDRIKHSRAFPLDAIAAGLEFIGQKASDIDEIVINYDPFKLVAEYFSYIRRHLPRTLRMLVDPLRYKNVLRSRGYKDAVTKRFELDSRKIAWHGVGHHLCHAASAFYRSPFDRSAILTSDNLGEFDAVLKALGEGTKISVLGKIPYPHSVGAVYSAVTDHLGFKIYSGEGTVMGLAGFGKKRADIDFSRIFSLTEDGNFEVDARFFEYPYLPWKHEKWVSRKFEKTFGPPRRHPEPVTDRHADIARALQDSADLILLHICRDLAKRTNASELSYAGGVALNGYSNIRVIRETPFKQLFIQPAANDGGTALGAALYHSHHNLGLERQNTISDTFLGPEYSRESIEKALIKAGIEYWEPPSLTAECAELLWKNRILGWFQGRMELGPRALGHRSILANPCFPGMKDHLNLQVKHREPFRPFAPIVPENRAGTYFDLPCRESPYMLLIVAVKPEWREKLPAITHIDATARVQTVTDASDRIMMKLLGDFEKHSSVPVLLNTSFNGPGEPIVCSPEDAIKTFLKWGLDHLAIGPFLTRPRKPD